MESTREDEHIDHSCSGADPKEPRAIAPRKGAVKKARPRGCDNTRPGREKWLFFFTSPLRTPGRPDLVAIGQDCSYGSETVGRVAWWHLDRANCDFEMVPRVLAAGNISVRQFCAIWGLCAFACGPRLAMRDRLRNFHRAHIKEANLPAIFNQRPGGK